jgi:hypothetical protein
MDQSAVDIVDVAPGLQLAGVVDESALVRQMHSDGRGRQLNVLLAGAEHARDPLNRPVLAGPREVEQNLGIFGGMLYAHAAVAVGAGLRANISFSGVSC